MLDKLKGLLGRGQRVNAHALAPTVTPTVTDTQARAQAAREQGNAHLAQDNFHEAARCYELAATLDPTDAAARINLGFSLCTLGLATQARPHLEQAVALQPHNHDAWYLLGTAQEQCADLAAAAKSFQQTIALQPTFELAYRDLCRVLSQSGQLQQARAVLDQGLSLNPGLADFHFYQGNLFMQEQDFTAAAACYQKALSIDPAQAQVHASLGQALDRQGAWDLAGASYHQAIALGARDAQTYNLLGRAQARQGLAQAAVSSYEQAIALEPSLAEAHSNLGDVLRIQGQLERAIQACTTAITLNPRLASAHNNLGAALMDFQDPNSALASLNAAIELQPDFALALSNRGAVLTTLRRFEEALASCQQALTLDPARADAWNNQGNTLLELNRPEEALTSFDEALRIQPETAEIINHRGNALHKLCRHERALEAFTAALKLNPNLAEALINQGIVLTTLQRHGEAVETYNRALAVTRRKAHVLFNRAHVLRMMGCIEQELNDYQEALKLEPRMPYLYGNWLHAKMQTCDWEGLQDCFDDLRRSVQTDALVLNPFTIIATDLSAAHQRKAVEHYVRHLFPGNTPRSTASRQQHGKRIRLGYFSADFHEHATAYLMAELFEQHDRDQFELIAFSFGPTTPSAMRTRLESAFDQFLVVNDKSDQEISAMSRDLGLDIAVDLKGFTQNCRPGIFALGAAPVQVNYLGYPGTMGASFIDYLVADHTLIPPEHRDFYSEKIAYLPGSYQVNDAQRKISDRQFTRAEMNLPEKAFVFCCFNNNYKITPRIFSVWMNLLQTVDASVLWLLQDNPAAARNLRAAAAARGVDPDRLVFATRMDLPDHLARHQLADLFLDTLHCNAHTTTSDALWAGLPVLTCMGDTFAGRVAASLLRAVQMPELVTHSLAEYESMAVHMAGHPLALSETRAKLQRNRQTAPLFNASLFARHIESAYGEMVKRHRAGLAPEHIVVQP